MADRRDMTAAELGRSHGAMLSGEVVVHDLPREMRATHMAESERIAFAAFAKAAQELRREGATPWEILIYRSAACRAFRTGIEAISHGLAPSQARH